MNTRHPTIDEIAEHDAGVSAVSDHDEIAEHLAGCADCAEMVARLAEVRDALAAVGDVSERMPEDVVARLDRALADATTARAAGIPSLSAKRSEHGPEKPSDLSASVGAERSAPRTRWVLATAAAVAVFAVGGALVSNGLPGSSSSTDNSAGADSALESGGQAASDDGPGAAKDTGSLAPTAGGANDQRAAPPTLNRDSVGDYAQALASGTLSGRPDLVDAQQVKSRCGYAAPNDFGYAVSSGPQAFVVFEGTRAVLSVHKADRRLTVFRCPGPARVLYRSTY